MATSNKKPTAPGAPGTEPTADVAYKALVPIHHDNTNYAVGDTIYLAEPEAAQLLAVDAVALVL